MRSPASSTRSVLARARRAKPRRVLLLACFLLLSFLVFAPTSVADDSDVLVTPLGNMLVKPRKTETWLEEQADGSVKVGTRPGTGANAHPIR